MTRAMPSQQKVPEILLSKEHGPSLAGAGASELFVQLWPQSSNPMHFDGSEQLLRNAHHQDGVEIFIPSMALNSMANVPGFADVDDGCALAKEVKRQSNRPKKTARRCRMTGNEFRFQVSWELHFQGRLY
jgi:hypothetical protein